jgi:hypothetical protein
MTTTNVKKKEKHWCSPLCNYSMVQQYAALTMEVSTLWIFNIIDFEIILLYL